MTAVRGPSLIGRRKKTCPTRPTYWMYFAAKIWPLDLFVRFFVTNVSRALPLLPFDVCFCNLWRFDGGIYLKLFLDVVDLLSFFITIEIISILNVVVVRRLKTPASCA